MWALCFVHSPGLSRSGSQVLHKGADLVGHAFCARPRSEQLRWPGAWRVQSPLVVGCVLSPPLFQLLDFLDVQWVHLLRCAVFLFWGADLWLRPSQQMLTVQDPKKSWLATKSAAVWYRMTLWGCDCPLPALAAFACLCLAGDGPECSQLALLSPLFCERAWQCLRLGLFSGSLSHSLGCYLKLVPSDCPRGIQAQSLA